MEVDDDENDLNTSDIFTCCSPKDESLDFILENPTEVSMQSLSSHAQNLFGANVSMGSVEREVPETSGKIKEVEASNSPRGNRGEVERFAFKVKSDQDILEDGYRWRKYGKKKIKSTPHPRNYFRCANSKCPAKKRVERDPQEPEFVITTYEGRHNHESPAMAFYIERPYCPSS